MEDRGGVIPAEEKYVKVLHTFADRIGSTIETASRNTGIIKNLLKIPPLPQQFSTKLNGARDPRMSVVLEVLQHTICLTAELAFIVNVLESRHPNSPLVSTPTGTHQQSVPTEPELYSDATKEGTPVVGAEKILQVDIPTKTSTPLALLETKPLKGSAEQLAYPKDAGNGKTQVHSDSAETSDKWTATYVQATQQSSEKTYYSSDEHSDEEVNKPPTPARTKVHIKDILTKIDKEIAQEKGKTKHVHAKATNTHSSPQLINCTANPPKQHTPTRPRIVVGQRPPKSFVKSNVIVEQNNVQLLNTHQEGVRNESKQQKHIEKLSRFFHSERPTSMELYRRNILREPGHDVIDKVQQFDSIANTNRCNVFHRGREKR